MASTGRVVALLAGTAIGAILAGGLVAAAGGEAPSRHLSWAAAYLVLVCGLGQVLLGVGQFFVAATSPGARALGLQFAAFNAGNAAVLAGTLSGCSPVLDAGSIVLLGAFGLFAWATRSVSTERRLLGLGYRVLLALLALSVPIGTTLGH